MLLFLDKLPAVVYLRPVHPARDSDHDSDLKRNGWSTCGLERNVPPPSRGLRWKKFHPAVWHREAHLHGRVPRPFCRQQILEKQRL